MNLVMMKMKQIIASIRSIAFIREHLRDANVDIFIERASVIRHTAYILKSVMRRISK